MIKVRKLRCSFCKRTEDQVAKLVAGPRVYICDRCVEIAKRLMNEEPNGPNLECDGPASLSSSVPPS